MLDTMEINNNEEFAGFLNLTCSREEQEFSHDNAFISTHDLAEMMLYSFVDTAPSVADMLWSKQQLNQGDFLTLTDGQEWPALPNFGFSTHEPYYA